ncbi:hypothetical protein LEMLEM_LOCUS6069, partial [Lemmus lemmus]
LEVSSAIQYHPDKLFVVGTTVAVLMTRYQHLHFLLCHLLFQCDEDMPDFSSHDGHSELSDHFTSASKLYVTTHPMAMG